MIPHSVGKCHEVTKGTGARQAGDQRTLVEGESSPGLLHCNITLNKKRYGTLEFHNVFVILT